MSRVHTNIVGKYFVIHSLDDILKSRILILENSQLFGTIPTSAQNSCTAYISALNCQILNNIFNKTSPIQIEGIIWSFLCRCQSWFLKEKIAQVHYCHRVCGMLYLTAIIFLVYYRYQVAIWVCLAIAEQHKPGPCNSRSNRQCNLLTHPSLVFVLKCLSFYPLRLA